MKVIYSDFEIDHSLRFVLSRVARCLSVQAVRSYNVRVVCMAVHCWLVCVSAIVHCARGVRIVGWRAAPAQNLLTYLAVRAVWKR